MKVAIVHDYLVNRGGAERVVAAMHRVWPDAPIFTALFFPDATYAEFRTADVRPSRLQRFIKDPAAFRAALPLYPRAFASMDFSGFDVVISSSAGFAHHVRPPRGTCSIVYAYSPPRFLWSPDYGLDGVVPRWARPVLPPVLAWLRRRDRRAAARPHFYLAVSKVARERLQRVYGRPSTVLYPPVFTERFSIAEHAEDLYLLVGRLLPYRRADLAVRAFTQMRRRLVVVGDGPARASLEAMAGPSIEFRGAIPDAELTDLYGRCAGIVVPGEEDFGLIPLEANAAGRPAIAFDAGGARETVIDGVTGVLFGGRDPASLIAAVERARAISFDPGALRAHAETFSERNFAARLRSFTDHAVESCIECARGRRPAGGA